MPHATDRKSSDIFLLVLSLFYRGIQHIISIIFEGSRGVRKEAKIRNRYNQVPQLTQDTTWESNKNTIKTVSLLFLEKFLKSFYHIWAWQPPWSCDQDYLFKLSFPHPKESPYENFEFKWSSGFTEEKMLNSNVLSWMDDSVIGILLAHLRASIMSKYPFNVFKKYFRYGKQ